jgi:hypothetical protein
MALVSALAFAMSSSKGAQDKTGCILGEKDETHVRK